MSAAQSDNVRVHRAGREKLTIGKRPQARLRCNPWLSVPQLYARDIVADASQECYKSIKSTNSVNVAATGHQSTPSSVHSLATTRGLVAEVR
ncbi:hypothetical protein LF1_54810 [Rubripirellula obstinata]|uniref:Uncharacterized protein n=1 Tax=Rubripirellula obstinata TaxID=406547 RepID=A0A5B1CAN8_9BACT|nr:hypothetical protein LF1_54810 [Rubripirellula obstinata]